VRLIGRGIAAGNSFAASPCLKNILTLTLFHLRWLRSRVLVFDAAVLRPWNKFRVTGLGMDLSRTRNRKPPTPSP